MRPISRSICWVLLALCATAHAAEKPRTFLVSPQTTVLERFTRVSDLELNYVFTVSDPVYYARSWTGETHLLRSNHKMFEYACHEGNYSMRNILEAARANDFKASSATLPAH
jgi:hypothetical protein